MAITKKQKNKLRAVLDKVNSLLFDISEFGSGSEITHKDMKGVFYIVTEKELGSMDLCIDKIYSSLEKIISELEEADGKA